MNPLQTFALDNKLDDLLQLYHNMDGTRYVPYNSDIVSYTKMFYKGRYDYTHNVAWPLITSELVNKILGYTEQLVSVGCGLGYLESKLKYYIEMHPTDLTLDATNIYYGYDERYCKIEKLSAKQAILKYSLCDVLTSWPCYGGIWIYDAIQHMKPMQKLFYIGEDMGGCTASDEFFDYLESNFTLLDDVKILQFYGLHDKLYIYCKNDNRKRRLP